MRLQENASGREDVGQETGEGKEKEGKQDTVNTPLTSPSDDIVQVHNNDNRLMLS